MRTPRERAGIGIVLALVGTISACATLGEEPEPPFATLVVENHSPLTVNVFAVHQTMRIRLGTIPGLGRRQFDIRRQMVDTNDLLRVRVEPIGSYRPYFSEPIPLREGDVVTLEVSNFIR